MEGVEVERAEEGGVWKENEKWPILEFEEVDLGGLRVEYCGCRVGGCVVVEGH